MNARGMTARGRATGNEMSETDSFINEVTEEVRRDRLYGQLRRYGWIAVVSVIVLVGGAAFNEYRKAQDRAAAEAAGDALLAALAENEEADRAAALAQVDLGTAGAPVVAMMTAASQDAAGDTQAAAATLAALATNADVPQIYRDLASFKGALLDTGDETTRRQSLEALAQPGAPFALLAQEQLALLDVAAGDTVAAGQRLRAIVEDAGATRGLRERAQRLMVSLDLAFTGAAETQ